MAEMRSLSNSEYSILQYIWNQDRALASSKIISDMIAKATWLIKAF